MAGKLTGMCREVWSQACCPLFIESSSSTRPTSCGGRPSSPSARMFHSALPSVYRANVLPLSSLVETNVAIIVECMPAFTQLLKVYVGRSAISHSLRLRFLCGSSSGPSGDGSKEERPQLATFGTNHPARRRNYYELADTALPKSQVAVGDGPMPPALASYGIVRSVGSSQQFRPNTAEHLA